VIEGLGDPAVGRALRELRHSTRDSRMEPNDVPAEAFEPAGFIAPLPPAVAEPSTEAVVCQVLGLITVIAGKWRMWDVADLLSCGRLQVARLRALVATDTAAAIKCVVKLTLVVQGEYARDIFRAVLLANVIRMHVSDPRFGGLCRHYAKFLCEASRYRIADGDAVDFAVLCARFTEVINVRANTHALWAISSLFRGDEAMSARLTAALPGLSATIERLLYVPDPELLRCVLVLIGRMAMSFCAMPGYDPMWMVDRGLYHPGADVQQTALFALHNILLNKACGPGPDPVAEEDLFAIVVRLCGLADAWCFALAADLRIGVPCLCARVLPGRWYRRLMESGIFGFLA